ncbi:transcription initiation factor TFIID subunit 12 [Pycnococcus provasolii]
MASPMDTTTAAAEGQEEEEANLPEDVAGAPQQQNFSAAVDDEQLESLVRQAMERVQSAAHGDVSANTAGRTAQAAPNAMTREALRAMLTDIAPGEHLDDAAEALLCTLASELAASITEGAAALAAHRGTGRLDAKDVDLFLKRCYGVTIPGFQEDRYARVYKRPVMLEEHRARLAATRRAQESAPKLDENLL